MRKSCPLSKVKAGLTEVSVVWWIWAGPLMFKKHTSMQSALTLRPYGVLVLYSELCTPNEFLVLTEYKTGKNDIFQSKEHHS